MSAVMLSDSSIAPLVFLEHLKSLYPPSAATDTTTQIPGAEIANPWYMIAAVAFASCNRPEAVPLVFLHALGDLQKVHEREGTDGKIAHEERLRLARRIRESLLKAVLLCGAPRAINGMIALHDAMPEDLRDKEMLRNPSTTMEEFVLTGDKVFQSMYGDTGDDLQDLFNEIYPDFGRMAKFVGYGIFYGQTDLLSQVETSCVLVAGAIGMDTPRQFGWHLANTRHGGASLEEARAVRQICIEVAQRAGIQWTRSVPDVQ